jgi:hypothetical protein
MALVVFFVRNKKAAGMIQQLNFISIIQSSLKTHRGEPFQAPQPQQELAA